MKKVLWGFGGIIVALVAAILVAPSFVDWNEYKSLIAEQAKAATGRDIEILGDIRISVIPAPAVRAEQIRVANLEGAATADMLTLRRLEVRVALAPLLGGKIQVQSVRLVDPVVSIERLADGRSNLVFAAPEKASRPASPSTAAPAAGGTPVPAAIRIDSFDIENGTIVYRDSAAGQVVRIEKLNGNLAAASLTGPMESSGSAIVRGVPMEFEASMGAIVHGRTVPFSAAITVAPGAVKTRISGSLSGLRDSPRIKGKLAAEGGNLGELLAALSDGMVLPAALHQPFGFAAEIEGSKEAAEVSNLVLSLAKTSGAGKLSLAFAKGLEAQLDFSVNRIDLDALLRAPATPAGAAKNKSPSAPAIKESQSPAPKTPAKRTDGGTSLAGFQFPKNISFSTNLAIEALTFRNTLIRQGKLSASLANGEVTLSQLSALLPGGSDFAVFGFAASGPNGPAFEGNIDMSSNDLRTVLKWAGVPELKASPERLRKLKFAGKVTADAKNIRLNEIDIQLDNTRIKGAATIAVRNRPAFGANIFVDRINLDGYLGTRRTASANPRSNAKPAPPPLAAGRTSSRQPAATAPGDVFGVLEILSKFDANVKAKVQRLTVRGAPIRDVDLDATLLNGKLSVRQLSVADLAGVAVKVGGSISSTSAANGAAAPVLKNVRIDLRSKNLTRFAQLAGIQLPVSPRQLGAVAVTGRFDGSLAEKVRTNMTVGVAGGSVNLIGTVTPLSLNPALDGRVKITHPSVARLLRLAGLTYRPAKPRFGGVQFDGHVRGDLKGVTISNMTSRIGPLSVRGSVAAALSGVRPKLDVDLSTNHLNIDDFLPAKRRAELTPFQGRGRVIPATWLPPVSSGGGRADLHDVARHAGGRWPTEPLDLSVLRAINADFRIRPAALTFNKIRVEKPEFAGTLQDGVLTTQRLTGVVFGGAMTGNLAVREGGRRTQYNSRLAITNLDVPRSLRASGTNSVGSGKMTAKVELGAVGGSVDDLVRALSGTGSLQLSGLDIRGAGKSSALAPVLGLVGALNQFAGLLSAKRGKGLADLQGTFQIQRGIAQFSDFRLTSNIGNGIAKGTIDLPNWQIDSSGEIQMAQNILGQLLVQKTGAPQMLPFTVRGRLDLPTIKLQTASLPNRGLPIPKSLLKKKGVGQILQGILGGGQQPQAPPPPLPQGQPAKPKVEDVLKGILRGLGR